MSDQLTDDTIVDVKGPTLPITPREAQLACNALALALYQPGAPQDEIDALRERLGHFIKQNGLWP